MASAWAVLAGTEAVAVLIASVHLPSGAGPVAGRICVRLASRPSDDLRNYFLMNTLAEATDIPAADTPRRAARCDCDPQLTPAIDTWPPFQLGLGRPCVTEHDSWPTEHDSWPALAAGEKLGL